MSRLTAGLSRLFASTDRPAENAAARERRNDEYVEQMRSTDLYPDWSSANLLELGHAAVTAYDEADGDLGLVVERLSHDTHLNPAEAEQVGAALAIAVRTLVP